MLADIILGIAAGFGAPYAEPHLKKAIEGMLLSDAPVTPIEMRMISFSVCLLIAAVLAMVFGRSDAVPLAIGAVLGVFGPRIIARIQGRKAPDYDMDDKE